MPYENARQFYIASGTALKNSLAQGGTKDAFKESYRAGATAFIGGNGTDAEAVWALAAPSALGWMELIERWQKDPYSVSDQEFARARQSTIMPVALYAPSLAGELNLNVRDDAKDQDITTQVMEKLRNSLDQVVQNP